MRRALWGAAVAAVVSACGEGLGPSDQAISLAIVPTFSESAAAAAFAGNADRLAITIERDSAGTFVPAAADTVDIDPATGEVDVSFTVLALKNPEKFRVTLEAIRASDNAVLFSGTSEVTVSASATGGTATPVSIPIEYTGPSSSAIEVTPADTAVNAGAIYTLAATVFDANGQVIDVPVTFGILGGRTDITVGRLNGVVTVAPDAPDGEVFLFARTADGVEAQSRLFVGPLPAGVVITPGFDNVLEGATRQMAAVIVDQNGAVLTSSGITWTSRNAAVAGVSGSGLVTANTPGAAVIVASGAGFSDSALINVPSTAEPQVIVSAMSSDRAFDRVAVGDVVSVTIMADMRVVDELLGSYSATFTWNPALFQFVDVFGADIQAPTYNDANVAAGELRFAQADASGASGQVTVARIQLRALASGTATPSLAITELSAAVTFTNLLSSVTVLVGQITVQ